MVNPEKPHKAAAAPPTVFFTKKEEFNPQNSATFALLAELDPNPKQQEALDAILNPRIDPEMDHCQPIEAKIFEPPKVEPGQPKPRREPPPKVVAPKSPSPRPTGPGGAAAAAKEGSMQKNNSLAPQQAAQRASEPRSGSSKGGSPVPDGYEVNSIGGRKKIAQSTSFNKLYDELAGTY